MYLATKNRGKEYAPLERVSWFVVSNLRKGVCALSHGIAPNVVMKWTGHSDYKAMRPYIDIVDSIKAKEMTKMDFMD